MSRAGTREAGPRAPVRHEIPKEVVAEAVVEAVGGVTGGQVTPPVAPPVEVLLRLQEYRLTAKGRSALEALRSGDSGE